MEAKNEYWTVYFYGTDKFINPDRNSEVTLDSLVGTYPINDDRLPPENSNWFALEVYGVCPIKKRANKMEVTNGGYAINRKARFQTYELFVKPFKYPDEMFALESLWKVLDHNSVFFWCNNYNSIFDSVFNYTFPIHPTNSCILVAADDDTENNFEKATKETIITMQKSYPVRR